MSESERNKEAKAKMMATLMVTPRAYQHEEEQTGMDAEIRYAEYNEEGFYVLEVCGREGQNKRTGRVSLHVNREQLALLVDLGSRALEMAMVESNYVKATDKQEVTA